MNITEEEARKKWCPMVAAADVPADANGDLRPRCIASECMAWRWNGAKASPEAINTSNALGQPEGDGWELSREFEKHKNDKPNHFTRWVQRRLTPVGHCGLAGKP